MNDGSEVKRETAARNGEVASSPSESGCAGQVDSWDEALRPIDHPVALRAHPSLLHRAQVSAAELTTAQRRYGEFLASVSHELRTPLATIRNSVCVMDMPNAAAVERQKARTRIERQVGRMVRLVDDLLEVSRIGSPRFRLARARLDLRGVVQQAIETVESELNQRNHRLTVAMPAAPVWLHADCGRLEQVFVNLLVNAAKYTDVGGDLRLSVQHEHAEAIVRVRDSGIGIAPENLPHVFDLFIQVDRSSRRSEGGLGIGLALARCFVEAHGGRVKATSAGLGRGSEFTVRLPAS